MSKFEQDLLDRCADLEKQLAEAREELESLIEFKKWCINNVKPFTTEERWKDCDMKQKLDELVLKDE